MNEPHISTYLRENCCNCNAKTKCKRESVWPGWFLALLGRRQEAIREGKRAIELRPESKDAFDGPMYTVALAQIYAWTGDKDDALQLIEKSLTTPNGLTAATLKLDPIWDPLRDDPRFQALINRYVKA